MGINCPSTSTCSSCDSAYKCKSCKDTSNYLYNGDCLSTCPSGTYGTSDSSGNRICKSCDSNCETCDGDGNTRCLTCASNKIKYNKNCLTISDNKKKTFISPSDSSKITSCYELYKKYIKDNGYECIDKPQKGYYISNSKTGLLSPCHQFCETCSQKYNDTNTNCDTCSSTTYKIKEGHCVQSCPEGYYQKDKNCLKCYKNCETCDKDMIEYSDGKLINMGCTKCRNTFQIDEENAEELQGIKNLTMVKNEGNCFPSIIIDQSKIIFNISEIYPEVQNGTCLFFNKSIYAGETECIEKPKNTFYVLNDTENTGVIKNCSEACETCIGGNTSQSTNCINCSNNYFKTEDSDTNCILSNLIPNNYYLNSSDNIYYKCHPNCNNCNSGYNQVLDDMNCLTCIKDYYFIFGNNKRNCYNITIINKGYYFKEDLFYPCDENCLTCLDGKNATSNNCVTCDNKNKGLYLVEDLNNCELRNYSGYYLDDNTNILKKCFNNCKTCNGPYENNTELNKENHHCLECAENFYNLPKGLFPNNCYDNATIDSWPIMGYYACSICEDVPLLNEAGNIISQNCLECIDNYHLKFETKDCYNDSIIDEGYYLSSNDSMYHKCDIQCKTCSEKNNCTLCNNDEGYYPIYNKSSSYCYNNETINKGYFLDEISIPINWKNCYKYCEACNNLGNSTNMNCISCKKDLINEKTSKPYFLKLKSNGNCIEECSNNLFLTDIGDCVSNCPNGTYQFSGNFTCLKLCPNNYEIDEEQIRCIIKKYEKTTSSEFKNQILGNITSFVNSSALINGSDFIAVVLSSDDMDPKEQLKKGISAIDLGNCTEQIKEYYNISKNESLIILNIESKRNETKKDEENNGSDNSFDVGKNLQIEIYDNSGRKLNLSVCQEDIKIMKYIGDLKEELNIESAKNLADSGIDVFNSDDEFFNNICHEYDNTDGKDIIINDRKTDIYKNISFCEKGCTYKGMDYELMIANCICDSSTMQNDLENNKTENNNENEKLNFNSIKKSVLSNLFDFNFDVVKCSNLVFNAKILANNIGFYFMLILLILQVICFFVYLSKKLKSIKYFLLIFDNSNSKTSHAFPPPKNSINNPITNTLDDSKEKRLIESSKKIIYIKSKFGNSGKNNKYNRKNKKEENKSVIIDDEMNNESTTKRKLYFMDDSKDLENIFNKKDNVLLNINVPTDNIFDKTSKKQKKLILTNNFASTINIQTPIINIKDKNKKKIPESERENINSKNQTKEKGQKINNDNIFTIKKKSKVKSKKNKKKKNSNNKNNNKEKKDVYSLETIEDKRNIKNNKDQNKLYQTDEDLQDMEYEQAIIYDKRSYLRMYWAFLVDTQIILGTFCTESYLNLFVIKLSFFICTFQISFFLNAFFYTDEYISNAYHNDGVLDFVSGLPKSIYSFLATLITTNLLRMLSNSKNELRKLIRDRRQNKNYIYLIDIKLRKLRKKLIAYFVLVFSLGIFFLYYVSSFCSVYRNSQKYWFMGCLQSFGIDSAVAILICIFLSLFRYIAIKRSIKCFYFLANLISTFL